MTNLDTEFAASCKKYVMVKTPQEFRDYLKKITEAALDFETTSIAPKDGKIRITSICNDDYHLLVDHEFLGPLSDYAVDMLGKIWYVYNAKFEVQWCDYNFNHEDTVIYDVDFMAKSVIGGYPSSLQLMAKRDLGIELSKEEQLSDWSKPALTTSQLDYAAFDSHVTWLLKKHWEEKMNEGHWNGFHVFNDAVRATVEAEKTGLILNTAYHTKLVALWERKQQTFYRYIRKWTPEDVIKNINSDKQLGVFFTKELHPSVISEWPRTGKTKQLSMESSILRALARRLPYPMSRWVAAVVGYRYYNKYLSTYGETLITSQNMRGRILSRFNIAQAATGRYSSSSHNLQNIPRKPVVRKSFHSPMKGTDLMCLADYKGIEVRVLAELSGDKQLLEDAIYGDVHAASAAQIYDYDLEWVMEVLNSKSHNAYPIVKERRSKAKGFTFQLTYGAGGEALSDVLHCSVDEAFRAIQKWAERYPKAYGYRELMFDSMIASGGYLPVCDGRTIKIYKQDQTMPIAANYPIQGAAASVMYRAMYHTRRLFVERDVDAVIAATVHDELLSYAHRQVAEDSMTLQLKGMELGWLDIFPNTNTDNLTDWKIGTTWADKP